MFVSVLALALSSAVVIRGALQVEVIKVEREDQLGTPLGTIEEAVGNQVVVTAQFKTCEHLADHTVTLNWGDGSASSAFFIPFDAEVSDAIPANAATDLSTITLVAPTDDPVPVRYQEGPEVAPGQNCRSENYQTIQFTGKRVLPEEFAAAPIRDPQSPIVNQRDQSADGFYEFNLAAPGTAAFEFEFHCKKYTAIKISRNGVVTFMENDREINEATNTASTGPLRTPSFADPTFKLLNFIAPFWSDAITNSNEVFYQVVGNEGLRTFVVEWGVPDPTPTDVEGFQLRLYEADNSIEFWYSGTPSLAAADFVGVRNGAGLDSPNPALDTTFPNPANTCTRLTQLFKTTTFTAKHDYLDDNPTGTAADDNTITVSVEDSSTPPLQAEATAVLQVTNTRPVDLALECPTGELEEGTPLKFKLSAQDRSPLDDFVVEIFWDDGSAAQTTTFPAAPGDELVTTEVSHTFVDDGDYTVALELQDDDLGNGGTESCTVTVNNVCPTVTLQGLVLEPGTANGDLVGFVEDPGLNDAVTLQIVWDAENDDTSPTDNIALVCGENAVCDGAIRRFSVKYNFPDDENEPAQKLKPFLVKVTARDEDTEGCKNFDKSSQEIRVHVPFENNKAALILTSKIQFSKVDHSSSSSDSDALEHAIVTLQLKNNNNRGIDVANVVVHLELLGQGLAHISGGRASGQDGSAVWTVNRLASGDVAEQELVISHRQHDEFYVKAWITPNTVTTCLSSDIACTGFPLNPAGSKLQIEAKYNARVHP